MQQPFCSPIDPVPPTIVVHDAAGLRLVVPVAERLRVPRLRLLSAPAAGCFLGPAWWLALMRIADSMRSTALPALEDLLDCGDQAGRALEALRIGLRGVVLDRTPQWPTVADRATSLQAVLLERRPAAALDLAEPGAERRIETWIGDG